MSIAGNLNKSEQKFLDCIRFRLFYGLYVPSHHFSFPCGEPVSIYKLSASLKLIFDLFYTFISLLIE